VLCLFDGWRDMPLAGRRPLGGGRLGGYSASAAIVAYSGDRDFVDDRFVINIGYVCHVGDVINRSVIEERSVIPIPAFIAATRVAESIVMNALPTQLQYPGVHSIPTWGASTHVPGTQ